MRSLFTLMFGLAFAAVLCVVSSVSADVTIFQDDLETGSVGDELSARVPPVGWKYIAEPGEVVTDTATSGIGGNSGKFVENLYTDAAWITDASKAVVTNSTAKFTMDAYVQAGPTATTGMTINIVDSGYGTSWWTGASVEISLTETGNIRTLDTGAAWATIGTFSTDTWVPLEINADFAARTYTASVGGTSWSGTFDAVNTTVHSFQYFWIGKSGYPENRYWDNLTITTVPEPSTLALLSVSLVSLLAYAWRKRK